MLIQVQLNSAVPSEFCEYKSFDNLLNYWVNTVNKKTVRSVASVPTADAGPGPTELTSRPACSHGCRPVRTHPPCHVAEAGEGAQRLSWRTDQRVLCCPQWAVRNSYGTSSELMHRTWNYPSLYADHTLIWPCFLFLSVTFSVHLFPYVNEICK